MHLKRRTLPHFETLSAALFATLALAAAQPARAQQQQQVQTPAATSGATAAAGIPANKWTAEQIAEAFKRTDSNADGNISRQEAAQWTGLARRFDQVDSNRDGQLSNAEFNDALK